MKITDNDCYHCLAVRVISCGFCILAYNYKFGNLFLLKPQPTDKIYHVGKTAETTVNYLTPSQSKGYIIPYRIYRQQTSAAQNLWGLQLWAKSVGMKVAEPFMDEHGMSFDALVNGISNPLRFSELFDRDFWNSRTTKKGCTPLVDWEELLQYAPRKAILVLPYVYRNHNVKNYTMVNSIDDPSKITGLCSCNTVIFSKAAMKYFSDLGFHYVREVCIRFK